MSFSITGLSDLLLSLVLGLLSYRFFWDWKRKGDFFAKLFFMAVAGFTLFLLIAAIGGIFFAEDSAILKQMEITAAFLQAISLAVLGYLIFYLKFPKTSPWFGFVPILFLGLVATGLTIALPSSPELEPTGSINWDVHPSPGLLRLSLFLATFIPLGIIFFQQALASGAKQARIRGFGLGIISFLVVASSFLDFFLSKVLQFGALGSDLAIIIIAVLVLSVIFLTQKMPLPKEKYVSQSYPKIPW